MKNKSLKFKIGVIAVLISIIFFLTIPLIPLLPLSSEKKVVVGTVWFIIAEVLFYGGGFLVGKEVFSKYKTYLNPMNWFKKKPCEPDNQVEEKSIE